MLAGEEAGGESVLIKGLMLGLGYSDASYTRLFQAPPTSSTTHDHARGDTEQRGNVESDAVVGEQERAVEHTPHTLLTLSKSRRGRAAGVGGESVKVGGTRGGVGGEGETHRTKIRIVALTQATHSYYRFVRFVSCSSVLQCVV